MCGLLYRLKPQQKYPYLIDTVYLIDYEYKLSINTSANSDK